jgi:hypothetical protein
MRLILLLPILFSFSLSPTNFIIFLIAALRNNIVSVILSTRTADTDTCNNLPICQPIITLKGIKLPVVGGYI